MKKNFEEIALEIIKTYLTAKQHENASNVIDYEYDLNSVDNITNKVQQIADQLFHNSITRDLNAFDTTVEDELSK